VRTCRAASGIGEATARLFVAEGARVIIADKNEATGATVAQSLGDAARFAALDVTSPQSWRAAVRQARDAFGKLDILVNCAGYYARHTMLDTSEDDFERHIAVNQRGVLFGMQAAAEAMGAGGAIINIASTVGLRGGPNELSYRTTKWAVRGLTRSAAHDLAAAGIRVNAVRHADDGARPDRDGAAGDHGTHPDETPRAAAGDRQRGPVPGLRRGQLHDRR
jgi:3alpha(or 20beta)-hydroxysteroid dehydrogenase